MSLTFLIEIPLCIINKTNTDIRIYVELSRKDQWINTFSQKRPLLKKFNVDNSEMMYNIDLCQKHY